MSEEPSPGDALEFPLDCHYRIIAENLEGIDFVIETVLMEHGINTPLEKGNRSREGTYLTFNVTVRMESLEIMNRVDEALRNIKGVKMVL